MRGSLFGVAGVDDDGVEEASFVVPAFAWADSVVLPVPPA